jgi:hypothetical protein
VNRSRSSLLERHHTHCSKRRFFRLLPVLRTGVEEPALKADTNGTLTGRNTTTRFCEEPSDPTFIYGVKPSDPAPPALSDHPAPLSLRALFGAVPPTGTAIEAHPFRPTPLPAWTKAPNQPSSTEAGPSDYPGLTSPPTFLITQSGTRSMANNSPAAQSALPYNATVPDSFSHLRLPLYDRTR